SRYRHRVTNDVHHLSEPSRVVPILLPRYGTFLLYLTRVQPTPSATKTPRPARHPWLQAAHRGLRHSLPVLGLPAHLSVTHQTLMIISLSSMAYKVLARRMLHPMAKLYGQI